MVYMSRQKLIVEKIEKIYQILDELQYNEIEQFISIQKNQNVIIKKLNKLQEYNEIDDMTQAIMDRRLIKMEQKITNL